MRRPAQSTRLLAATALIALATPGAAHAAGFALKEQSASGQGTSFAGATAGGMGDASGMFFNPAAMGLVQGNEVMQVGTFIAPYSDASNVRATRATALGGSTISGTTDPGDAGQNALIGSTYAVMGINNDLKLGLAITVPWGLVTDYPGDWAGRYHARTSKLLTVNFQPTLSYQVTPEVILGAGMQIQYIKARLTSAVDFGSILASATRNPALAGRADGNADLKGDDIGYGGVLGVVYQPLQTTRFGLSYRSAVRHELRGDVDFQSVPTALQAVYNDQQISAKVTTPEVISFGAYHELNSQWAVMADVQWTNWSRFHELRIDYDNALTRDTVTDENWNNSWFVSLGTAYKYNEKLTLRAGVAFDQSPVPEAYRTPRIPDQDRYWVSLGAGYKVTENFSVDVGYTHIFVKDSTLDLHDTLTTNDAFRGNLSGSYDNAVDIVAVQARLKF